MYLLLAAIAWRAEVKMENTGVVHLSKSYKFGAGGSYDINFTSLSRAANMFVGLVTEEESAFLSWYVEDENAYMCNGSAEERFSLSRVVSMEAGDTNINGEIRYEGTRMLYFGTCDMGGVSYKMSVQLRNENTLLSMSEYALVYVRPVICVIVIALVVLWFVNWVLHFSTNNKLHLLFTIAFVLTLLQYVTGCVDIFYRHKSDDTLYTWIAHAAMRVVQETFLMTIMGLAANGWYILRPHVRLRYVLADVMISIGLVVPSAVREYANLSFAVSITMFCLFALNVTLFCIMISFSAHRAEREVTAHLIVIQEAGIDPKTTPIYTKRNIFVGIIMSVLGYFMLYFTREVITFAWALDEWIMGLMYYILLTILTVLVAWFFRMKKETKKGYFMMDEGGDGVTPARVFTSVELSELSVRDSDDQAPWHEGMPLPLQPVVTNSAPNDVG